MKTHTETSHEDPIFTLIGQELSRQQNQIELIASENIVSEAVLRAQGSILTNKYAEGYPHHRYYGGCTFVDQVEDVARERAKALFKCRFANVQPHSGSQANQAVFLATLRPGDTILGMSLPAGGHLTHGAAPNLSGKWFHAVTYDTDEKGHIDYDAVSNLAMAHKPKLLIAGGSAYPRLIDFARMREIADSCNALLLVDMAHFAGLVAGGVFPSPFPHAHMATTTTHKTLRGPRGGMILTNDENLAKKIDSAIFPGLQGGPLMHVIAAKAVAFGEALTPQFSAYASAVLKNASTLAHTLLSRGYRLVSGGTDCHLVLVDLTSDGGTPPLTGKDAEVALERAGLTCNKNSVPNDPLGPLITSGIRLGTPAATTRGFGEKEFQQTGLWIADILDAMKRHDGSLDGVIGTIHQDVQALCAQFPIYPHH